LVTAGGIVAGGPPLFFRGPSCGALVSAVAEIVAGSAGWGVRTGAAPPVVARGVALFSGGVEGGGSGAGGFSGAAPPLTIGCGGGGEGRVGWDRRVVGEVVDRRSVEVGRVGRKRRADDRDGTVEVEQRAADALAVVDHAVGTADRAVARECRVRDRQLALHRE